MSQKTTRSGRAVRPSVKLLQDNVTKAPAVSKSVASKIEAESEKPEEAVLKPKRQARAKKDQIVTEKTKSKRPTKAAASDEIEPVKATLKEMRKTGRQPRGTRADSKVRDDDQIMADIPSEMPALRPKRQTKGLKKVEAEPVKRIEAEKRAKIQPKGTSSEKEANQVCYEKPKEDEDVFLPPSPQKPPLKRTRKKAEEKPSMPVKIAKKPVLKKALNPDEILQLLDDDEEETEEQQKTARANKSKKREAPPPQATRKAVPAKKAKKAEFAELLDQEDDDEVSFNMTRSEKALQKKKPIYMRTNSTEAVDVSIKNKTVGKPAPNDDPYEEIFFIEEANDGKKKKKPAPKKRKPKKQKADIILTFGSSKKASVAPVLKQMKNLKTPSEVPKVKVTNPQEESFAAPKVPRKLTQVNERQMDSIVSEAAVPEQTVTSPRYLAPNYESVTDGYAADHDCNDVFQTSPQKRYHTPAVTKHMAKLIQDRKASTPRLDEAPKAPQPVSKEELIKKCFGFEDSSESEANENESLVGFSPVKMVPNTVSKNKHLLMSPARSSFSTTSSTYSRFTSSSMASSSVIHKNARPARLEFKMPARKPVSSMFASKYSRPKIARQISNTQDVSSKVDTKMEVTLFDDIINAENEENVEEVNQEELVMMAAAEEVERHEEKANAYDVLKAGKKKVDVKAKKKPLKTVTNTTKNTKQSLIYEHSDGGKKQLKSKKKVAQYSSESDENGGEIRSPLKRKHDVSRTYSKTPLNTSVTASPAKKCSKKDRELDRWASLQTSHFSEIEDFDLSFN